MSKPPPAGQPRPNFPPITPPPPAGPRTDPPPPGPKTNQLEVAVPDHTRVAVRAALDATALGLIAVACLLAATFGSPPSEPLDLHWRPTTEQESQQRQGDRLMEDLTHAYQDGAR
jgi:hypothetical protein